MDGKLTKLIQYSKSKRIRMFKGHDTYTGKYLEVSNF